MTRRPDGQPETPADQKFFDLRESGYRGPIDQDGNVPAADDRRVDVLNAMASAGTGTWR
jgi:hypothetical protein